MFFATHKHRSLMNKCFCTCAQYAIATCALWVSKSCGAGSLFGTACTALCHSPIFSVRELRIGKPVEFCLHRYAVVWSDGVDWIGCENNAREPAMSTRRDTFAIRFSLWVCNAASMSTLLKTLATDSLDYRMLFLWVGLCATAELLGIGSAAVWYGAINVWVGEPVDRCQCRHFYRHRFALHDPAKCGGGKGMTIWKT